MDDQGWIPITVGTLFPPIVLRDYCRRLAGVGDTPTQRIELPDGTFVLEDEYGTQTPMPWIPEKLAKVRVKLRCRIVLGEMGDDPDPIPSGSEGTFDWSGPHARSRLFPFPPLPPGIQLQRITWDNGRGLNVTHPPDTWTLYWELKGDLGQLFGRTPHDLTRWAAYVLNVLDEEFHDQFLEPPWMDLDDDIEWMKEGIWFQGMLPLQREEEITDLRGDTHPSTVYRLVAPIIHLILRNSWREIISGNQTLLNRQ